MSIFKRSQDSKIFYMTYMGFLQTHGALEKSRVRAKDGETDDVTRVSENFFVSGDTGHTYRPENSRPADER